MVTDMYIPRQLLTERIDASEQATTDALEQTMEWAAEHLGK
jgi:hypothetical protein